MEKSKKTRKRALYDHARELAIETKDNDTTTQQEAKQP